MKNKENHSDVLQAVESILRERRLSDSENSYSAKLMRAGQSLIKRKVGEEAVEVILTEAGDKAALRQEITDLWFHCLVLMVYNDLALDEVLQEFSRRLNISGLQEKAQRTDSD